ncbi:MAG: hypothetical protein F6K19_48260 [Cyanothece sp. SIO1E1]|nr:hypothetical protein [Cyanothece sp. SIO1E1]
MTEDLAKWRELCEWLDQQPSKSAFRHDVPPQYVELILPECRQRRQELGLITYASAWGWRLQPDWQQKLEQ